MHTIEWEVAEGSYREQIDIPREKMDLATGEGINTKGRQKVTVRITNLNSGESYTGRVHIMGTNQIHMPVEIQEMLKDSGKIRIQILGT